MIPMRLMRVIAAAAMLLAACEPTEPPGAAPPLTAPPSVETTVPSEAPALETSPSEQPEQQPSVVARRALVTRVVDGDTAVITIEGVSEKVRFIGVNTPESTTRHEPYGAEASAYTKRALSNKTVYVETDVETRDRYGRLLAYVWLAQPSTGDEAEVRRSMFNARLLLDGIAQVATYPPNVRYVDLFTPMQREARDAKRGLWGAPSEPVAAPAKNSGKCDPSYPDVCIAPPPPDLDCKDIPYRRFRVVGADPHHFDGNDNDGIGCES
jgi:micrococcal nuclease